MSGRLDVTLQTLNVAAFVKWLARGDAALEESTNEWELVRFRAPNPAGKPLIAIIYTNSKGRRTLYGEAARYAQAFLAGEPPIRSEGKLVVPQNPPRRRVELFTDASNYHTTKAGAWAAVLITPDGQFEASGALKGDVKSSTAAEACAVANALHHFLKSGAIQSRDKVTVVCDNVTVVNRLEDGKRSKKPDIQAGLAIARGLRARFDLALTAQWIKGHQPKAAIQSDPRVAHNHRCDELCGAHSKALHDARASA